MGEAGRSQKIRGGEARTGEGLVEQLGEESLSGQVAPFDFQFKGEA